MFVICFERVINKLDTFGGKYREFFFFIIIIGSSTYSKHTVLKD